MKFTDSHEWIESEQDHKAKVGVSKYAQKELGDIVYIELPTVGKKVNAGQEIAVLESTKAAADIYAPASGVIIEVNSQLSAQPELVNQDPEGKGWIVKLELSNPAELDLLMDQQAYQDLLNGA
jgi:glycine cleavage system H protein